MTDFTTTINLFSSLSRAPGAVWTVNGKDEG